MTLATALTFWSQHSVMTEPSLSIDKLASITWVSPICMSKLHVGMQSVSSPNILSKHSRTWPITSTRCLQAEAAGRPGPCEHDTGTAYQPGRAGQSMPEQPGKSKPAAWQDDGAAALPAHAGECQKACDYVIRDRSHFQVALYHVAAVLPHWKRVEQGVRSLHGKKLPRNMRLQCVVDRRVGSSRTTRGQARAAAQGWR